MRKLLYRIKTGSLALYQCGLAHLALLVVMLIIAQFDHRQLMGINLWTKPVKFALSISIYCLTWPLFLHYFPYEHLKRRFVQFTIFAMVFEMVAIASQAARGQLSHFATSGLYNIVLYSLMGVVIVAQTLFALYIGVQFFKVKTDQLSATMLWAIRLGIIITCIFALEGGIMGSRMAHTVGAVDGGPGLPLLNWSRVAGDLRIAHFMGLHALQIIPLFVIITRVKIARPIIIFALIYFVLVSFLMINAFLGRPLF
jgi:hypothetical protein